MDAGYQHEYELRNQDEEDGSTVLYSDERYKHLPSIQQAIKQAEIEGVCFRMMSKFFFGVSHRHILSSSPSSPSPRRMPPTLHRRSSTATPPKLSTNM